jgi:integrase
VPVNMMEKVAIGVDHRVRDRVYNDDEVRATWQAADKLGPVEGSYIKLLILLAPRKSALAAMRRSDLDSLDNPTLWTTPHELVKAKKTASRKRVYLTPLPPLAQRLIKGLLKGDDDRVFPTLAVYTIGGEQQGFHSARLVRKVVALGAPKDFAFHAWRHTVATWLENEGASEWERALVLNHAGGMSVTAGYSHGFAGKLKLELLTKWSDHVERLVQPEGVAVLR